MVSRRDFLKLAGLGAGAALGSGFMPRWAPVAAGQPAPAATATAQPKYKGRNLCFVLWDHQLARYGFRPRNMKHPVPETCPLYSGSSMRMTPAWTEYWRGILHLCNPGMKDNDFEQGWRSLITSDRAFTNGTGPEEDADHWAVHSLTCGGATHEMVTGINEKHGIRIYTLNWQKGPPPIPEDIAQIDMTRHFFATTGSNLKLPDGTYAVYGFPQFENCIVPLMSMDDTDFIDAYRIKPVSDLQPPYHTWASQMPKVGRGRR